MHNLGTLTALTVSFDITAISRILSSQTETLLKPYLPFGLPQSLVTFTLLFITMALPIKRLPHFPLFHKACAYVSIGNNTPMLYQNQIKLLKNPESRRSVLEGKWIRCYDQPFLTKQLLCGLFQKAFLKLANYCPVASLLQGQRWPQWEFKGGQHLTGQEKSHWKEGQNEPVILGRLCRDDAGISSIIRFFTKSFRIQLSPKCTTSPGYGSAILLNCGNEN